jgi:hypothetical protein
MQAAVEQSAASWFERAARSYVEHHQGCPWCGGRHCVFRSLRPEREQYSCYQCDFFTCHVHHEDLYLVTPGTTSFPSHE